MKSIKLKTLAAWILILSLLWDNVFLPVDIGFDFRLQYIIFILAIPVYLLVFNIKINPKVFLSLFLTAVFLLITPLLAGTPLAGSLRQLVLIFICFIPFYFMVVSFQFQVNELFAIYLKTSVLISVVALIQFFSFIVDFTPGYDFSYLGFDMSRLDPSTYRVQGWMMEPSFLAYFLMPAVFFSVVRIFNVYETEIRITKTSCFLILSAMLLTGSLIAYLGIVLMILIIIYEKYSFFKNPTTLLLLAIAVFFLSFGLYRISPQVQRRVDDTVKIFSDDSPSIRSVNLSTVHFYNNFLVTWQTIKEKPLTGVGFGNYYIMYDKHAKKVDDNTEITPDGASLLFRLVTETGLLFSIFFLLSIFHYRINIGAVRQINFKDVWVINNGIFILIVMRLIRMPHYIILGLPLFLILYYLTYKNRHNNLQTDISTRAS